MSEARKTVFLVDDNETNLLMGKQALAGRYNVITLTSGARLFKALGKITPGLILLDVEMPEMNGYDVLARLKSEESTAHIPVVFLSAYGNEETERQAASLGAADYITKPFSPALLIECVEKHLSAQ